MTGDARREEAALLLDWSAALEDEDVSFADFEARQAGAVDADDAEWAA